MVCQQTWTAHVSTAELNAPPIDAPHFTEQACRNPEFIERLGCCSLMSEDKSQVKIARCPQTTQEAQIPSKARKQHARLIMLGPEYFKWTAEPKSSGDVGGDVGD